jgi:hypothetical protein
MKEATEFEIMRSLHTLWMKGLITWEQVEELLIASTQLELIYLNEVRFEAESLDGDVKYKIEGVSF